jgi:hypothetical protein
MFILLAAWQIFGPVYTLYKIQIMSYPLLVPSILAACKYPSKFIYYTFISCLSMARYPIAIKSNNIDLVPAEKKLRVKHLIKLPLKYKYLTAENCKFNLIELSIKLGGPNLLEALFS